MLLKKIYNFIGRKIRRIYEKYCFHREAFLELSNKCADNKKIIWFIGSAHYDNIGDLAISEATIQFLEKYSSDCNIIEIRLCDYYKYYMAIKKLIKPGDIIVMQGGGNMGFLYFDAEFNRRDVIKHFPKNKIIIFPSTIDYGNSPREKYELKNSIRIYNKHNDLWICAREEKSYNQMKAIYKNVISTPDIVLSLNYIDIKNNQEYIVGCLRSDGEKTPVSSKVYNYLCERGDCVFTDNIAEEKNVSITLRKKIFIDKLNELSKAKLVVTDRLHTMIFCTLIEIPCLFIDNTNCKLSEVYNKWIKEKCNYIKKLDLSDDFDKQIMENSNIKIEHYSDFSKDFNILIDTINS